MPIIWVLLPIASVLIVQNKNFTSDAKRRQEQFQQLYAQTNINNSQNNFGFNFLGLLD
jgi:hypothetical protein